MRKVLIASAVAVALFSVGAFAASFLTVNSEDIASGKDNVVACADVVDVDFSTVYSTTAADWEVSSVKLTFFDGSSTTPTADCNGFGATVVVDTATTENAASGESAPTTISGGTVTITLNNTLKAADVAEAHVLVDGENLKVATPGGGL